MSVWLLSCWNYFRKQKKVFHLFLWKEPLILCGCWRRNGGRWQPSRSRHVNLVISQYSVWVSWSVHCTEHDTIFSNVYQDIYFATFYSLSFRRVFFGAMTRKFKTPFTTSTNWGMNNDRQCVDDTVKTYCHEREYLDVLRKSYVVQWNMNIHTYASNIHR